MALRQAAPLTGCGRQQLCTDTNGHLRARGRAVRDLAPGGEIDRLELARVRRSRRPDHATRHCLLGVKVEGKQQLATR